MACGYASGTCRKRFQKNSRYDLAGRTVRVGCGNLQRRIHIVQLCAAGWQSVTSGSVSDRESMSKPILGYPSCPQVLKQAEARSNEDYSWGDQHSHGKRRATDPIPLPRPPYLSSFHLRRIIYTLPSALINLSPHLYWFLVLPGGITWLT